MVVGVVSQTHNEYIRDYQVFHAIGSPGHGVNTRLGPTTSSEGLLDGWPCGQECPRQHGFSLK